MCCSSVASSAGCSAAFSNDPAWIEAGRATRHILGRVISRLARWYDERPVAGDACLAALMLLVVVTVAGTVALTALACVIVAARHS
jgi:hypothetical protein